MLYFTNQVQETLNSILAQMGNPRIFVLVDTNTQAYALPLMQSQCPALADATVITIQAGDTNKTLAQAEDVWRQLTDGGATRQSLLVNLGGGMVTDLGGFTAASFKRGIPFINIPTTLLGAVDAAVGGKTGVNFHGLKNQVGAFAPAQDVIISTIFLHSLPLQEILSGYAEMLKHGLIDNATTLNALMRYDVRQPSPLPDTLLHLIKESVHIKKAIADADPKEEGLRRVLNLGHTVGHAFESLAMERQNPVPHGFAVAWGLVVELVLSHMILQFPSAVLHNFAAYVLKNYGAFPLTCDDYPQLLAFMSHDKKNASPDAINFTLLHDIGRPQTDCQATQEEITAALDIFRDLFHI